ncbi:MAG TPA: signal peptidase II [Candidatus Lachnoclostridium avicola]|nr:signal peptidase II [Candidatus Lachnoclostridium avicola]
MIFLGLIGFLVLTDLALKAEIESRDGTEFPRNLDEKGRIVIHKSHNAGLPFGFLKRCQETVRMVPVVTASAVGGILLWLLQKKGHTVEKLGFSLTLAGALSNIYDRLTRHYVVDYFSINWGKLKKVIFNLGDMFIFLGGMILLLHEIWESIRESGGTKAEKAKKKK